MNQAVAIDICAMCDNKAQIGDLCNICWQELEVDDNALPESN